MCDIIRSKSKYNRFTSSFADDDDDAVNEWFGLWIEVLQRKKKKEKLVKLYTFVSIQIFFFFFFWVVFFFLHILLNPVDFFT